MRKKVLITIGVIVVIIVAGLFYMNNRNRTLSPPGQEVYENNGLRIEVNYSRPSVRGRLIFGTEEDGALQPYGVYWRLGANEVTTIELNEDVSINGNIINAGKYGMYAIPGIDKFTIGINEDASRWGYSEADYSSDILTTESAVEHLDSPVEQYAIRIEESPSGALVLFEWSDVRFVLPIDRIQ